jgi:hypothetical protein
MPEPTLSRYVKDLTGRRFHRLRVITLRYVWRLFLLQQHRCSLTGELLLHRGPRGRSTASLDRIDSSRGYVRGNVQWVHKDVNIIKGTKTQEEFIQMCRRVVEYANKNVRLCS